MKRIRNREREGEITCHSVTHSHTLQVFPSSQAMLTLLTAKTCECVCVCVLVFQLLPALQYHKCSGFWDKEFLSGSFAGWGRSAHKQFLVQSEYTHKHTSLHTTPHWEVFFMCEFIPHVTFVPDSWWLWLRSELSQNETHAPYCF